MITPAISSLSILRSPYQDGARLRCTCALEPIFSIESVSQHSQAETCHTTLRDNAILPDRYTVREHGYLAVATSTVIMIHLSNPALNMQAVFDDLSNGCKTFAIRHPDYLSNCSRHSGRGRDYSQYDYGNPFDTEPRHGRN